MPQSYSPELKGIAYRQIQVEQNRCAMADRGCCAVFLYISSKSSDYANFRAGGHVSLFNSWLESLPECVKVL